MLSCMASTASASPILLHVDTTDRCTDAACLCSLLACKLATAYVSVLGPKKQAVVQHIYAQHTTIQTSIALLDTEPA